MFKQEQAVALVASENQLNQDYEIKIEEMTDEQILSYLIEKRNLSKLDRRVEKHKKAVVTNKRVCCSCGDSCIQYSANAWFDYNTGEFQTVSDDISREIWCENCVDYVDTIKEDDYCASPKWIISSNVATRKFISYDDFENHIAELELEEELEKDILTRFQTQQNDFYDYGTFTVQYIIDENREENQK